MKALLPLAATALLTWAATAPALATPPPPADLSIVSDRGQVFSLVLDGQLLTRPLARQLRVGQLLPGRHWADFSVPTAYGPPMRFRTAVWLAPGAETDYVLTSSVYGPQLRQVGTVPLGGPWGGYGNPGGYPAQPQPGNGGYYGNGQPPQGGYYGNGQHTPYNAPYGGPNMPSQPTNSAPGGSQGSYPGNGQYNNGAGPQPAPTSGQSGGYHNGSTPNFPAGGQGGGYHNGSSQPNPAYPAAPGSGPYPGSPSAPAQGGPYPPAPNSVSPLQQLSPDDAADLTEALRQRPTDDDRLDTAKQTLDQSTIRAADLAALLGTLEAEGARVELAEFGYAHVADPQNFPRVYGALQSSASVRQVQQALGLPR